MENTSTAPIPDVNVVTATNDEDTEKTCFVKVSIKNIRSSEPDTEVEENHDNQMVIGNKLYSLEIFDTTNDNLNNREEEINGLSAAHVVILTGSIDDINSSENLHGRLPNLPVLEQEGDNKLECENNIVHNLPPIILVGLNYDLWLEREVAEPSTDRAVKTFDFQGHMECSSLPRQKADEVSKVEPELSVESQSQDNNVSYMYSIEEDTLITSQDRLEALETAKMIDEKKKYFADQGPIIPNVPATERICERDWLTKKEYTDRLQDLNRHLLVEYYRILALRGLKMESKWKLHEEKLIERIRRKQQILRGLENQRIELELTIDAMREEQASMISLRAVRSVKPIKKLKSNVKQIFKRSK